MCDVTLKHAFVAFKRQQRVVQLLKRKHLAGIAAPALILPVHSLSLSNMMEVKGSALCPTH